MAIELPKDAEGRDIPLGTKVLYDSDGNQYEVSRFTYSVLRDYDNWDVVFVTGYDRYASETFLKPPDSWEKLKAVEDYGNSSCIDNPVCRYTNMVYKPCVECKFHREKNRVSKMCADILDRIRKLKGEGK